MAKAKVQELLQRTGRTLTQRTKDKTSRTHCTRLRWNASARLKPGRPTKFGVKLSIATTLRQGLAVGLRSMPGNPYDGHTLAQTLEQVGILTGTDRPPITAIVDKGRD